MKMYFFLLISYMHIYLINGIGKGELENMSIYNEYNYIVVQMRVMMNINVSKILDKQKKISYHIAIIIT